MNEKYLRAFYGKKELAFTNKEIRGLRKMQKEDLYKDEVIECVTRRSKEKVQAILSGIHFGVSDSEHGTHGRGHTK